MKVRIPLAKRWVGELYCPRPVATLLVRGRYGEFFPLQFAIDTGADITSILIPRAELEGVPFRRTRPGTATGLVGRAPQYRDVIHVSVAGREYDWPCNFLTASGPVAASFRETLPVLGRAGFLDAFNLWVGDGSVVLTRRSSWRRSWNRVWSMLGWPFVRSCTEDEPI
jgi:hypothetical protein